MAKPSEDSVIKGLKTKLSKARDKIKKLEDKRDEGMKLLEKMPGAKDAVYAAGFVGLTTSYYYGLVDILPKFLFQFGVVGKSEKDWQDSAIVALTLSPAAIALDALGVDVGGILKVAENPQGAIWEELTKLFEEEKEAFTAKKAADPSGALEAAARKEAADRGEPYIPSTEAVKVRDAQKKKALWNQIDFQAKLLRGAWAAGMASATLVFLDKTTPTEVADMAAKLLDAVTPFT